jgi:hypothetical protein
MKKKQSCLAGQGKKMLQRTRSRLARFFVDPTRIVNRKIEL